MIRNSNWVLLIALLFSALLADVARSADALRLLLDDPARGRLAESPFFVDGQGQYWLSSATGVLCFDPNGALRARFLTTRANFVVGDNRLFIFPRPAAAPAKGKKIDFSPDIHVEVYRRDLPEPEWADTVWKPHNILEDIHASPMWVDRNGLLCFREADLAVAVNDHLDMVNQQPSKFLNHGTNGLYYEIELIWNTKTLPWKDDHWELRFYDQSGKLAKMEQNKDGFSLIRNFYGEVVYVKTGAELYEYDPLGAKTRTIKLPSNLNNGQIGPDGNYYCTGIKQKQLIITKFVIPKA